MDSQVRWSLEAATYLEQIGAFIEEQAGRDRASAVVGRLYGQISTLPEWPRLGTRVAQRPGYYQRIFRPFRVIYRLGPEGVTEVVRIFHTRQEHRF